MRFAIKTFGCKVNQYESGAIAEAMLKAGFEQAAAEKEADVFIVNSCAVTADSAKKALREARRLKRAFPETPVVLTGCFPQAFREEAGACGADIVTGTGERTEIPALIKQFLEGRSEIFGVKPLPAAYEELPFHESGDKTRAFLKIEDGCDSFCSYCVIPYARGRVRSRPLKNIREEARRFAAAGHKEIVLVGINLSCYGKDNGLTLADAVEAVCAADGIERVRLSSLEPDLLDEKTLERFAAQEKLCPHFHLSLQSGCDETLRRMNRHYTTAQYLEIVDRLRKLWENCAVTTDIMAGFAGETENEFEQTLKFAETVGFAKIHAFSYSPREGTAAAKRTDHVPESVKQERFARLCELDKRLHADFLRSQTGTVQSVLVQKRTSPDYTAGLTPNYTPVRIYGSGARRHEIINVKITEANESFCTAEEIQRR